MEIKIIGQFRQKLTNNRTTKVICRSTMRCSRSKTNIFYFFLSFNLQGRLSFLEVLESRGASAAPSGVLTASFVAFLSLWRTTEFPPVRPKFSAIRVAVLRLFLYQGELYKIQTRNGFKPFEKCKIILIISHCSKSSFFVQKFNFDFQKKLPIFLGEKLVKMLWFWTV